MKTPTDYLLIGMLTSVLGVNAQAAQDKPDFTGFYTSAMAIGIPAAATTGVAATAPPIPAPGNGPTNSPEDDYTRFNCIPDTTFGYNPYGEQLVQTPGRLTWINQYNHIVRRIDIVDAAAKTPINIRPTYHGYSMGHWEGDTLVVVTTALRRVQARGAPNWQSVQKITERIHKPDAMHLQRTIHFEATTTDGKPVEMTSSMNYELQPEQKLSEYICEEAPDRFDNE
jgi:hypothetical protein